MHPQHDSLVGDFLVLPLLLLVALAAWMATFLATSRAAER